MVVSTAPSSRNDASMSADTSRVDACAIPTHHDGFSSSTTDQPSKTAPLANGEMTVRSKSVPIEASENNSSNSCCNTANADKKTRHKSEPPGHAAAHKNRRKSHNRSPTPSLSFLRPSRMRGRSIGSSVDVPLDDVAEKKRTNSVQMAVENTSTDAKDSQSSSNPGHKRRWRGRPSGKNANRFRCRSVDGNNDRFQDSSLRSEKNERQFKDEERKERPSSEPRCSTRTDNTGSIAKPNTRREHRDDIRPNVSSDSSSTAAQQKQMRGGCGLRSMVRHRSPQVEPPKGQDQPSDSHQPQIQNQTQEGHDQPQDPTRTHSWRETSGISLADADDCAASKRSASAQTIDTQEPPPPDTAATTTSPSASASTSTWSQYFLGACIPANLDNLTIEDDPKAASTTTTGHSSHNSNKSRNDSCRSSSSSSSRSNPNRQFNPSRTSSKTHSSSRSTSTTNNRPTSPEGRSRYLCGAAGPFGDIRPVLSYDDEARQDHRLEDIEDPTVQESIECVFAHQLECGSLGAAGGSLWEDSDEDVEGEELKAKEDEEDKKRGRHRWSKKIPTPRHLLNSSLPPRRATPPPQPLDVNGQASSPSTHQRRSDRNKSAVAAALGIPHPLAHTASDAELVAAARRSASASGTEVDNVLHAPSPRRRTATTGSIRHSDAGGSLMDKEKGENPEGDESKHFTFHELSQRTWSRKFVDSRRLVFIGTMGAESRVQDESMMDDEDMIEPSSPTCLSCHGGAKHLPHAPPHRWPQAPLLLRPTPGSGTRIRGIRYSGSDEYLWVPPSIGEELASSSTDWPKCWSEALQDNWQADHDGKKSAEAQRHAHSVPCEQCAPIPVNNGNEPPGESLVVDFESDYFVGTLLIRIRNSQGTTPEPYNDSFGYFAGLNRCYQAVVRGMFKKEGIAMTDCVTGQVLNRPCGKLPPKMMLRGAVKVISFFAPQLITKLDGKRPTCISPLGSTPQVMRLKRESGFDSSYQADQSIELSQTEPDDWTSSLLSLIPGCELNKALQAPTSMARAKARKKAFDKLYAENDKSLVFDTSTEYSFEFLQHLIDFEDFGVDLGSMIGKVLLREMLAGQPLKFMAAKMCAEGAAGKKNVSDIDLSYLWSFDIFHESVYEDASKHERVTH